MKRYSLFFLVVVAALAPASSAVAAFPGQNGKIVFQKAAGSNSAIWTIEPDGSGATPLTDGTTFDGKPVWSPDGSKIAFWSTRTGNSDIFVMNANGSGVTNLTNTTGDYEAEPAWSPDGTKIAFMAAADGVSIHVMNADGSGVSQVTSDPGFEASPAWSPDGSRIAYADIPDYPFGDSDIATVDPDGTDKTVIATGPTDDFGPDWSPDGTRIVFDRDPAVFANTHDIWVMNADGTGRAQLTSGSDREVGGAFSPDGTKIAFSGGTIPGELFTMNPDGTGRTAVGAGTSGGTFPDWQPIGGNQPPDCSAVRATPASLGAPNHRLLTVTISGATDPDGDTVDLEITGVTQDEPQRGPADAFTTTQPHRVRLRAERDPRGDGRVYRIAFEASDGSGGTCTGFATASVRKGNHAVDSAPPSYDSFGS